MNPALLLAALALLGAFLLTTIWHELGHLVAARFLRVPVRLVAFGQGPALWARTFSGVRFEVRALPLGMAIGVVGRRTPEGLPRRPIRHDIAVAASGPLASFVLTILLFALAALMVRTAAGASSGPLSLTGVSSPAGASSWLAAWLIGTGLLSSLLALLNLVPLPGLDGGHLVMLALALRGWQLSPQREVAVQRLGVRLTAVFSLVVAFLLLVIKAG